MDSISLWALGVCCCAVMTGIAELLISDTGMEKIVRFVLGGVMLCAVLLPLKDLVPELIPQKPAFDISAGEAAGLEMEELEKDFLAGELKELVVDTLKKSGITPKGVKINMDIDDDRRINIITAEVMLSRTDAKSSGDVSRLLRDSLGMECRTVIC